MKSYQHTQALEQAYELAKSRYAQVGIHTDEAIRDAGAIPISLQCWQGDDVRGFEGAQSLSGGGILATGNYPGWARNGEELRADAVFAFSLIPGAKRFNLHSIYGEPPEGAGKKRDRDALEPEDFHRWMAWSKAKAIPLDFNPTFFAHPLAEAATLSHKDPEIRRFWIRHALASRRIASAFGENQGSPAINNLWIPDGSKDMPADRLSPRLRLKDALDEIFAHALPPNTQQDSLECKLFGIGSEAYVVGSHEFYLSYAVQKQLKLCLDMGHFHPTERIADKMSGILPFVPGLLIHFSRGLHWDSDHVAIFSDETRELCREIKRTNAFERIAIALDFFDASINRIAAWTIGARSVRKALLEAFLEPTALLVAAEQAGKYHERLALMEALKTFPFAAVWDKLCLDAGVPVGTDWFALVDRYEHGIQGSRV
ncbi:MAG: L-rhamnose isomerase [Treponema sp.]|jgi:L-rhamnose isomerase|nr:L-rhamnose isomerase [Treponema sp.]